MMNHKSSIFRGCALAACVILLLNGCAAIVGGGTSQPISISSEPSGAHFVIKSSSGIQMAEGSAPQTLRLPRKNEYQIIFSKQGYKTQSIVLTKALNGWVWGNLIIGWLVGFIIDFASGSAYKLEPAVIQVTLETALLENGGEGLFAVVRLLDQNGKVVEERSVKMEPISSGSALDIPK